ncbi:MAG: type III-B CRISPR-associated protein Cas10/Cmr2, partial [Bacteroidales bacterium]
MAVPWKKDNEDIKLDDLKNFIEESEVERWEELWQFAEKNGEFPPNIGFLYQLIYTSLEKSMGARKNLRDFEQTDELGKKCHLCGEKEGVINIEKAKANGWKLKIGKFISEGERLCIICFTKRALERYLENKFPDTFKNFSFPSTAEVASTDFKEKVIGNGMEEFKKYIEVFKNLIIQKGRDIKDIVVKPLPKLKDKFQDIENIDGEWLFEENLTQKATEKNLGVRFEAKEIERLKSTLKEITDKIGKPNPYYAVIMLDADNMGKWLSGDNLPSIEYAYNSEAWEELPGDFKNELKKLSSKKLLTPAIHASISNALKNYSLEFVRKIVEEEHLGKLVYAGGDDVLAFVNLKDLFEVMKKLRAAFSGHIKINDGNIEVDWQNNIGFVEKDGKYFLTMGPKASASCGVVIAHYKMPLKLVLDKVRETEKKAKNIYDKDAFAIALIKHSGQIREFVCKWRFDKDTEKIDAIEKMREIGEFFTGKDGIKLSKTFIQKIHNEFVRLKDKEGRFS